VHNTDDDGLLMFFVRHFSGFNDRSDGSGVEVRVVELWNVDHPIWTMIFNRFGKSNQILVMKINTVFMSYEFLFFLQLILIG